MANLINGRTIEEIKDAVMCTEKGIIPDCVNCPYYGEKDENGFRAYKCHQATFDLMEYVQRLEAERDALYESVKRMAMCKDCKSVDAPIMEEPCKSCKADQYCDKNNWAWKGVRVE